jgi:hypothetical protein
MGGMQGNAGEFSEGEYRVADLEIAFGPVFQVKHIHFYSKH